MDARISAKLMLPRFFRPVRYSFMLDPETQSEIAAMVRSGFYDRDRLVEIFAEEMYAPGELHPEEVAGAIDANFAAHAVEKESYPPITDCDRLDSAFMAMNQRGIIAIQNAGYTQSDGYDEVGEVFSNHPDQDSVRGYCFYHEQDLHCVMENGELRFAFGPVDPADEQTLGIEVGNIVREELIRAGFTVQWNGTFENRLCVPNLVWQKR
jgi:hypothetical protein